MSPNAIFSCGLAVCGVALVFSVVVALLLWQKKRNLDKQLDADYGRRRHQP